MFNSFELSCGKKEHRSASWSRLGKHYVGGAVQRDHQDRSHLALSYLLRLRLGAQLQLVGHGFSQLEKSRQLNHRIQNAKQKVAV